MNVDDFNYDDLTENQKQKLKELALSLGYKIEGTSDDEVREYYRKILKNDEEFDIKKKKNNG